MANQEKNKDTMMALRGSGKGLWDSAGGGDAFLRLEREGWDEPEEPCPSIAGLIGLSRRYLELARRIPRAVPGE